MGDIQDASTIDAIRWTFRANPDRRDAIEAHLTDLGLDVYVQDGTRFTVIVEEPAGNPDATIAELWRIHGEPFAVTHEEFRRLKHLVYEADGEEARSVA